MLLVVIFENHKKDSVRFLWNRNVILVAITVAVSVLVHIFFRYFSHYDQIAVYSTSYAMCATNSNHMNRIVFSVVYYCDAHNIGMVV